ncbi:MAG: hypothetical protein COT92_01475 [Candidatus Doudnabacteria bacterium CG10_big_fil_rev_8_21_14_0_10_42_18]|uniref:Type II secretion system protein GspG C-terminal domain-containing protein n=1 Tax=Candidatus Doudnabacteria bacterium CG10_big_fil_rev_8_21_14_0_10_42_18 TaxID=1974552 RepID=A0A2H0VBA4_9BACT|nr:MAG: hypothetical protein COT92_01475 [Candidatus Doudnabacteria bacterium CG10_big_fil_rev_8_21_14_0_10_42_18]
MEENQNTNPPEPAISPERLKSKIEASRETVEQNIENEKEGYLLFNVMPKNNTQAEIKAPSIKITEEPGPVAQNQDKTSFFVNHKKKLFIGLGVIILAAIAYFAINYFINSSYKDETFLVNTGDLNNNQNTGEQNDQFTTPSQWREKYFSKGCLEITLCGDNADPERDGLKNIEEYSAETDPNNPDSDQDGIADGDEVNVFISDPTNSNTAGNKNYNDADFFEGGYSLTETDRLMTEEERTEIGIRIKKFNLHEPTVSTLAAVLNNLYGFAVPTLLIQKQKESNTETFAIYENIDQSAEAKQDRDAQRTNTIKKLSVGLIKYYDDLQAFPVAASIKALNDTLKPYNKIATNTDDPINLEPYVYTYQLVGNGEDFNLTYFSETQTQLIRITKKDAEKYKFEEEAAINDEKRKTDLQMLRTALLLYSNNNVAGEQIYVFPTEAEYKTAIIPDYIGSVPKDPRTAADYDYQVSENFNSFTLKALLDDPPKGTTGFLCNQEECRNY